ncbi:type II toxin-antitoxin system VapC family toxin [Candidatus Parabeggiatoa sp. HSG14]|uniref:type II toxin-antitoxin system VapC family toxin n=1 Tax=Candidatus Parabeggiatoa sp. HSG14 TaxID=3055593 RepID=UPI0025A7814F|nr:type II toxin-antitoxin system VapC family toxin [Thiotrichales bacterium HSG14]
MDEYVLDTSALLAYIESEAGAIEIENLLNQALEGKVHLFISVISSIEVFYISWQEQGMNVAMERLQLLNDLPLFQIALDNELIQVIGKIKATQQMSFADSCIAGLSKFKKATLVHKDPEFEQLEKEINQLKLPYKNG